MVTSTPDEKSSDAKTREREKTTELTPDEKSSNANTGESEKITELTPDEKSSDANTGEREKITELASDEKSSDAKMPTAGSREFQALGEKSKPIDNTLTDLTQQVSAIREYAANQQGRLEKLQDGYDWNIIRTFCLRVIRAVDNLESRITQLKDDDTGTTHLEEVRDELIFALESSGIEQFEPETESEYRGQEKLAEAVKEKQGCDDPERAGKIANVIRPGYQYFINDGNVKIVRPAQVRLYA